jgi:hypothetical protein
MSQDLEAIFRAIWYPKHWAKSCLIIMQQKWNETCTKMRRPNTLSSQVQQKHSSILRLSLRQYVEQRTDITFTLLPVSFTFWNLCRSSSRLCRPVPYFFLSDLICYLSLCTSATQLMCEPCNVLQSGPRFDFLQPFFSFWNLCRSSRRLCRPVPYGPMQRLCHPAHFFPFVVSQNSSIQ